MKEKNADDGVTIDSPESRGLSFGQEYQPQNQNKKSYQDGSRTDKALLLSYRTEDKVSVLFGHILQFGLRAIQETFSSQPAGADGNLGLVHIISRTYQIFFQAQHYLDTDLLMRFQYIVKDIVTGIQKSDGADGEQGYQKIGALPFT